MDWRERNTATKVDCPTLPPMKRGDPFVLIGSCFATEMGKKLLAMGENAIVNPLGTLFNPISIADSIQRALSDAPPRQTQFVLRGERWVSFDCHSDFNGRTQEELAARIAQGQATLREGLLRARMVVVTFGTALLFRRQGIVVTNCHKQPSKAFSETLAGVEEIVKTWRETLHALYAVNPEAQVVLTVSPVRHALSGMHRNAVSKAILLKAAMRLSSDEKGCHYFPAFEIVLDELRDYRYFLADLSHPSPLAVNIVAQRFWNAIGRTDTPTLTCKQDHPAPFIPSLSPPRLTSVVEVSSLPPLRIARPVRCIGSSFAHALTILLSQCGLYAVHTHSCTTEADKEGDSYNILCLETENSISNDEMEQCAARADIVLVSPARIFASSDSSTSHSLATTILMAHHLLGANPHLGYFPAFEILHDELRDYRFYADDLHSPSPLALQIIAARLVKTVVKGGEFKTLQRYETLQQTLTHRPSDPHAPSYLALLQRLRAEANALIPKLHPAVGAKLTF